MSIRCPSRPFRRAEAFDVVEDAGQAGPRADGGEALLGRPVEGDPEGVEPFTEEPLDEGVVEERRVGRDLGF